jgi:phospholipid:diacylglycerol acyltransferase
MSDLRRRIFGVGTPDSTPSASRDSSPAPARPGDKVTDYKIVPADRLEKTSSKHRGRKRRNAWVFGLGGLFGVLAAGIFASPTGSLDRLADMAGWNDLNLESILDVLPAGLIKDVQQLQVCTYIGEFKKADSSSSLLMVDEGVFDCRAMRKKP